MSIKLNTRKNQLTEKITMHIVNNGNESVKNLLVRNIAYGVLKYDHQHFKATRNAKTTVKNISSNGEKLTYTTGKDKSNLFVNKSLNAGQSTDLTVNVVTDVPQRNDRFGYQKVNNGKLYNLSFCFPYLSDYRNSKWNYHPYYDPGENRNSAISNFHVNLFAPKSYKVAASGQNTTKKGMTTIDAKNMREVAIVASNKFKVSHTSANGIKINNYYLSGKNSKQYNKLALMTAKDSFNLFTKDVGTYPYQELDMTESLLGKDTGGMEYPGLVMIDGSGFIKKTRKKKTIKKHKNTAPITTDKYTELTADVAHEIGHQWFYGTVGSDEYMEPWLDEGLTSFLENSIYDLTYSKSKVYCAKLEHNKYYNRKMVRRANQALASFIKKIINQPNEKTTYVNRPVNKPQKGIDTDDMAYDIGNIFPLALMETMGKNKFFAALHDYYQTYYLKQATTQDFLNIIRKYDNSKKVNYIINRFIDSNYLR
ncbi:aminopeptidase [Lactobacillus ultunensis DSM 16047]|nr:aminopeptidase [Lactobacillus ultunensis DSM 16047]